MVAMESTRRTQPSPLPGVELARMKAQLASRYGSELWDRDGARVLVVRVPRDEPDLVNDLEQAVQYLAPADVAGTPNCLLVGNSKTHLVPAQLLQDLMTSRVNFDRRQCAGLRPGIPPGQHRIYRAPEDPHHLARLVVRVGRPTVAELDDADIAGLVAEIGPRAHESPYAEVRVVYLIADKDEVRVEADLFFQDLHGRWVEQVERHQLAVEVEAKENAQRSAKEAERQSVLAAMESRRREITAVAPMRRPDAGNWEASPPTPGRAPEFERAEMYARLDALEGTAVAPAGALRPSMPTRVAARAAGDSMWPRTAQRAPQPPSAPAQPAAPVTPVPAAPPPQLAALQERLSALKFDVLVKPPVAGIDLAGERAEGYPQRIIAFAPARLDVATAERVLAAARDLDADMAIVVCDEVDPDAKRMFIATKARHLELAAIATLEL